MKLVCLVLIATMETAGVAHAALAPSRSPALASSAVQGAVNKAAVLERLKALKEKETNEIANLETAIRKQLETSTTLELSTESLMVADHRASRMTDQIQALSKKKEEASARREIIDRLIFMVDTKYTNQAFRTFLEQQFIEMASNDLADGRDGKLWKALTYLSICVREVPEPREDVLDVIEGYLDYTNVLDPKTPADFMASRNYMNGSQSEAAATVPRDKAADDIEVPSIAAAQSAIQAKATPEPVLPPVAVPLPAPKGLASDTSGATSDSASGTTSAATSSPDDKPVTVTK